MTLSVTGKRDVHRKLGGMVWLLSFRIRIYLWRIGAAQSLSGWVGIWCSCALDACYSAGLAFHGVLRWDMMTFDGDRRVVEVSQSKGVLGQATNI